MIQKRSLAGVVPALTTPFRSDQSLDVGAFERLVDIVIGDGVHAMIVNGCTGESWALSDDERAEIFKASVRVTKGRLPIIAGCSGITSAQTIAKVRQAEAAGCDVAMISPPWYIMPGPDEIADHYRAVIDVTDLPILLYNIPRRTGVHLPLDLIDRLADHPRVVGIKESSKDWGTLSSVIRGTRDRISVFAGFASFFGLAALTEGAVGYMDSGTPVFGARSLEFYKAATTGDIETARTIQNEMAGMLNSFFGLGTFPASVKASLDLIGRPGGRTRDPIRPLTLEQRNTLRRVMEAAKFISPERLAETA